MFREGRKTAGNVGCFVGRVLKQCDVIVDDGCYKVKFVLLKCQNSFFALTFILLMVVSFSFLVQ